MWILSRFTQATDSYRLAVGRADRAVQVAQQIDTLQGDVQRAVVMFVLTRDPRYNAAVSTGERNVRQAQQQLRSLVSSSEERTALDALDQANQAYSDAVSSVLEQVAQSASIQSGLVADGSALYQERSAVKSAVQQLVSATRKQADALQRASEASARSARTTAEVVTAITVALAVLLGTIISRALSSPIRATAEAAGRVAAGDLTVPEIVARSRDESGELAHAFNQMLASLRALVSNLKESSRDVRHVAAELTFSSSEAAQATSQISQAVQQVAQAAAQQASDAEAAGTAVSQVGQAVDQVARGAEWQASQLEAASRSLAQLMQHVDAVAQEGERVLSISQGALDATHQGAAAIGSVLSRFPQIQAGSNEAVQTVQELGERSKRIGDIVKAVSEIADRTNLLALNAAIEAARAGEHGRGFSVVAQEIRSLAQQSARSTEEIAQLLGSIADAVGEAVRIMQRNAGHVEESAAQTDEARTALQRILDAVQASAEAVGRMTAGTRQAAEEARSVVKAVEELSGTTEENASAAEEMAASARAVSTRVENLAATAQETAAAAEEVSASVEELEASSAAVHSRAQDLARLADMLEIQLQRFRLSDAREAVPGQAGPEDATAAQVAEHRPAALVAHSSATART